MQKPTTGRWEGRWLVLPWERGHWCTAKGPTYTLGDPAASQQPACPQPHVLRCVTWVKGTILAPHGVNRVPEDPKSTVHRSGTHGGLLPLGSCGHRRTFRKSSTSWGSSLLWYRTPCHAPGGRMSAPQTPSPTPASRRSHHRLVPHPDVKLQALPPLLQRFGHPVGDTARGEVRDLAGLLDLG